MAANSRPSSPTSSVTWRNSVPASLRGPKLVGKGVVDGHADLGDVISNRLAVSLARAVFPRRSVVVFAAALEQLQIDSFGHRLMAGVVRVQVIPTVMRGSNRVG